MRKVLVGAVVILAAIPVVLVLVAKAKDRVATRLRHEIELLEQSQVAKPETTYTPSGDTVVHWFKDKTASMAVLEWRKRAESSLNMWERAVRQRDSIAEYVGFLRDSVGRARAESIFGVIDWRVSGTRYSYTAIRPSDGAVRLDRGRVGRRFSVTGTPTAVVIDQPRPFLGLQWDLYAGFEGWTPADDLSPRFYPMAGFRALRDGWLAFHLGGVYTGVTMPTLRVGVTAEWRP